jgi:hypothetical protein
MIGYVHYYVVYKAFQQLDLHSVTMHGLMIPAGRQAAAYVMTGE